MPLAPNPCANCGAPVAVRRPSSSGKSFCKLSACQTAKQRFYRERRNTSVDDLVGSLVSALASGRRVECHGCGLENAVPGWAHRDAPGSGSPCFAVGALGAGLPSGMLDRVHPERAGA